MADSEQSSVMPTRPIEPEWRAAQRCRVVFGFDEGGACVETTERGWARIDGSWLHFSGDKSSQENEWHSWPMTSVICVDWDPVKALPF